MPKSSRQAAAAASTAEVPIELTTIAELRLFTPKQPAIAAEAASGGKHGGGVDS